MTRNKYMNDRCKGTEPASYGSRDCWEGLWQRLWADGGLLTMIPERATAAARGQVSSLLCLAEISLSANVAGGAAPEQTIRKIVKASVDQQTTSHGGQSSGSGDST